MSRAPSDPTEARAARDAQVRAIVAWHLSPETGTPYWLDQAADRGLSARDFQTFDDLAKLPRFDVDLLRSERHERFVPRAYAGRPFRVFETGGTTGAPAQRPSWRDHEIDYERFGDALDDAHFPRGGAWLMLGPTGPRRLRLSVEHLAHHRGGMCYHVDLDPRWVRTLQRDGQLDAIRRYKAHVVQQGLRVLENRPVSALFTTPLLLEALGEAIDLRVTGIRGVFCGGTSMTRQSIRFLCEEVLGPDIQMVPTYGNTLMGLAVCAPPSAETGWDLTYYAPEPRAVLRVVDPETPDQLVPYETWGRVELTTLTRELLVPRMLERDEALRRPPTARHPWDGVAEVRPFRSHEETVLEGVY